MFRRAFLRADNWMSMTRCDPPRLTSFQHHSPHEKDSHVKSTSNPLRLNSTAVYPGVSFAFLQHHTPFGGAGLSGCTLPPFGRWFLVWHWPSELSAGFKAAWRVAARRSPKPPPTTKTDGLAMSPSACNKDAHDFVSAHSVVVHFAAGRPDAVPRPLHSPLWRSQAPSHERPVRNKQSGSEPGPPELPSGIFSTLPWLSQFMHNCVSYA